MKVNNEIYQLIKITPYQYEFFSEGAKGKIKKVIAYEQIKSPYGHYFNLGFGDYNELTKSVDDQIITNNGDTDKILFTVVHSILDFMNNHPKEIVYAKGSTSARTRLYQMGIARILEEINIFFKIYGFIEGNWQIFQRGKNYSAFMIKDKNLN